MKLCTYEDLNLCLPWQQAFALYFQMCLYVEAVLVGDKAVAVSLGTSGSLEHMNADMTATYPPGRKATVQVFPGKLYSR